MVGSVRAAGLLCLFLAPLAAGGPPAAMAAGNDQNLIVTLLGTGDPIPSATRNGPAILVQAGGLNLMFDAGRGNTVRLRQAGLWPGQIDAVFVTHFHSDHLNGLGDLLTLGYIGRTNVRRSRPLEVIGPVGMKRIAEAIRSSIDDDVKIRTADEKITPSGADMNVRSKVVSLANKTRYDDDGNPIKPPTPEQISRTGRGPLSSMGGFTAAHYAARQGHMAAVQALVDAHADVNLVSGSDGTSALLVATANGHFDVARYLLDHGADPNLADESGLAPLYAAVDAEWAPLGWAPNPITGQEKTTHLELMRVLLDRGADPNLRLRKKLWFRSLTHDQHWVTTAGATAFWRAAQASDVPVMKLLATRGADPNIPSIEGTTPLLVAAGVGWGANFHRNLHGAWVEAAAYCLELGLDVNAEDRNHFTAIHGAAYRGDLEMMKLFIARGAKLDVRSKFGYPTDMANGPKVNAHLPIEQPEAMKLLLDAGAPPPVMPKPGQTTADAPKRD